MKVKLTTVISSQSGAFIKIHKYSIGRRNEIEKLLNSQLWGLKSHLCGKGQWYLYDFKTGLRKKSNPANILVLPAETHNSLLNSKTLR